MNEKEIEEFITELKKLIYKAKIKCSYPKCNNCPLMIPNSESFRADDRLMYCLWEELFHEMAQVPKNIGLAYLANIMNL